MHTRHGRSKVRTIRFVLFFVLVLTPWSSSRAADVADETCMMCHGDRTVSRSRDGSSVYVDASMLAGSVHESLSCTSCHSAITDIPHAERVPAVRCASCHGDEGQATRASVHGGTNGVSCADCHGTHGVKRPSRESNDACRQCHTDIVDAYRGSVHGRAIASGDTDASACRDCHGDIHAVRSKDDPASPTNRLHLADTCGKCHADRELMTKRQIAIPDAYQLFRSSVHGRSNNPDAAVCNDCHESHHLLPSIDPASSINRLNIPKTCGRCHPKAESDYEMSVHGQALARGVTATPVCTDCHGEHLIRGASDPNSPVASAHVTTTCSHCHEAQGIRETYGLPAGRLSSYEDSFHGLAARGGSPVVANCASCHGHHDILPSSDPRSAINPAHLVETCGKCHPGASAGFARGSVHEAMVSPSHPILGWVRSLYIFLIVFTIGGMLLHNGIDFFAKLKRHLARQLGRVQTVMHDSGRHFVRMTQSERMQHAVLAVSFLLLVYTGFALKFPEAWPFAWFARLERGYALRSWAHRTAAVVMVGTALVHVGYWFSKRGRSLLPDMMPKVSDVSELWGNVLYMLGRRKQPPPFKRFSYMEKVEYLALIWGTVIMTVTGFALWFETEYLTLLPKWSLDLMTIIHYYEAWLAFLAIVVWHWYQTIVNPDVYPMNWTWLTGEISEEHMRHEHGGELAQIEDAEAKAEAEAKVATTADRTAGEGGSDESKTPPSRPDKRPPETGPG